MASRYFIGIDLGTSNCALSYIDSKAPEAGTQIFAIPQYESLDTVRELNTLPSFYYYLKESEHASLQSHAAPEWSSETVVGLLARARASEVPARTVTSAKSWLCHAGVDRESKLLPWKSEQIAAERKCSPVVASAAYLDYLRYAWDQTLGAQDKQSLFDRQEIVITVPASFDTVAQQLTLDAAEYANYPKGTRLLEEPQAAFYAWLEQHHEADEWTRALGVREAQSKVVLVCDIGGGTSDFSLFELSNIAGEPLPQVRRIAVSNHILLGGDNIDLALAHLAEAKLGQSDALSSTAWSLLTAQCRELKERVLSSDGPAEEIFTLALTIAGGSLFDSARTVQLKRGEVTDVILDGFYPRCEVDATPIDEGGGLREIGLPYARDSAITRHLADFINGRTVDAVLFNGGSLSSPAIQARLAAQLTDWQDGREPSILANEELDLAVARGAAWYQASLQHESIATIEGGSGHSFYFEVSHTPKRKKSRKGKSSEVKYLVCVLPQGCPVETCTRVTHLDLALKVNAPVRFQAYTSTCREEDKGGDLIPHNTHDFQPLPSMHTMAQLPADEPIPEGGKVSVELEAHLNALGLLRVDCVSVRRIQEQNRRWRLDFNLRQQAGEGTEKSTRGAVDYGVSTADLEAAGTAVHAAFDRDTSQAGEAAQMLKQLETITHQSRREWKLPLIRELWQRHSQSLTHRDLSPEHEVAWLNAAGYFLRPGYGHALDEYFIRTLWTVYELDLAYATNKASREQYFLLWRRVAGGLDKTQQELLYAEWIEKTLQDSKQSYEPARMLGAFEHLSTDKRIRLAHHFTDSIINRADKFCDHSIWALGRVLNRVPLYGGEHAILPPREVERAFESLKGLDWSRNNLRNLSQTFVQAARIVNHRDHDVPIEIRDAIITKATQAGNGKEQLEPLRSFTPIDAKDIQQLFGESLPVGLSVMS